MVPSDKTILSEPSNFTYSESHPAYVSEDLVELVDLFPTLAEITKLPVPPLCKLYTTNFCTEGLSFYPVIKHYVVEKIEDFSWKTAVFSQYPRPSKDIQMNSDQPKLKYISYMGYSIRTHRFRYTEWVSFNNTSFKPDWKNIVARELYDHKHDPYEANDISDSKLYNNIVKELSKNIRRGWRHALPADLFNIP